MSVEEAFKLGWIMAAQWAERPDLVADTETSAYVFERNVSLYGSLIAKPPVTAIAAAMPGTDAWSIAVFEAIKVPVGTEVIAQVK